MKLHHVALTVKDLNTSLPFYENLFGFKEVKRFRRDDMGATGCFLQGDNTILTEKGVMCGEMKAGASGGTYFFLSDPDGNQIEVYGPAV
jgi:catechol 2,3-dioxygenase-like lactoylglutathione lyase family enzyme